jgi:SAM-dependent methyltransferase
VSEGADPAHLARLSRVYGPTTWDVYEMLDRSLEPRGPDWLHERAAEFVAPGAAILDAGCRDAEHLIRLVQQHECVGVGVEPVALHVERGREAVARAGLADRISLVQGTMDEFGHPAEHFDFAWCRDVLEQVEPLAPALDGVFRVLKPGARMLVYTTVVTDLLAPAEADMLKRHIGNVWTNLHEPALLEAFAAAGFELEESDPIGTEWREYSAERSQTVSRALLGLARLRRQRESVIAKHGQDIFEHVEANLHWELFQFLGKLLQVVYVLRKPAG